MVGWDQVASDFRLCKWPPPLNSLVDEDLARYFDELNSKEFPSVFSAEQDKCQVITFSHFLPRYVVLGGVYTHGHLGQSNWVSTLMYACLLFPCFPWKQESKMSVVQQLSFLISTKDLLASLWSFSVSCIKIDPFFFSYVCRFELCPEKRMLFYPNLPKVVGSDWLEARVRSIHGPHGSETACHVFGHTHFCWDATLDGIRWAMDLPVKQSALCKRFWWSSWWVFLDEQFCSEAPFTSCKGFCSGCDRYIQAPLAYPKERERRMNGGEEWLPLCIYDSEKGGLIGGPLQCYWSEYYSSHSREPENTELAPWVADRYHPVSAS